MIGHQPEGEQGSSAMRNDYLDLEAYLGGAFLHPGGVAATLAMLDRLNVKPGQRVLEIGCGTGATTLLIAQRTGAEVVALDRSSRMLASADRRLRQHGCRVSAELVQSDMNRTLPFADGTFDAVLAESVIALLDDVDLVAQECARILRSGGRLAFNERIWKHGVPQPLVDEINSYSREAFGIQSATRQPLDHAGWARQLEQAGLTNVEAIPVRGLATANTPSSSTGSHLRRRLHYLRRPSAIYQALRFKRLARRYPDYWAQQENYLFFAHKPNEPAIQTPLSS
jgi:ubiquinone/menaquinone biosynthesis C-methylase UbiE